MSYQTALLLYNDYSLKKIITLASILIDSNKSITDFNKYPYKKHIKVKRILILKKMITLDFLINQEIHQS
jgi:hypothetical protein